MAVRLAIFGRHVTDSYVDDPAAVGFAAKIGTGLLALRQPQSQRPLFDRLASGEPVALSADEHAHVERLGIKLNDVTEKVREADAWRLHAAGVPVSVINVKSTPAHFKPVEPVKIVNSFIPAKDTY